MVLVLAIVGDIEERRRWIEAALDEKRMNGKCGTSKGRLNAYAKWQGNRWFFLETLSTYLHLTKAQT